MRGPRERVLVMAEKQLSARLQEEEEGKLVLVLLGAVLDDSAPRRVVPGGDARVRRVQVTELFEGDRPEVRVAIARTGDQTPQLLQRGAILAVEFERPERGRQDGIPVQYENAPLARFVEDLAKAIEETWVYDDSLEGQVTVIATDRVERDEAESLLHTALRLNGFAALPNPGGGWRVVQIANAVPLAPYRPAGPSGRDDRPVVTLQRLNAASAEELVSQLDPWLGASAVAIAEPRTNAIILAGPESQVHDVLSIIGALDEAAGTSLLVRRIRHGDVEQAATLLEETFAKAPPGRGIEVWADPRTGFLVVRGVPESLAEARERLSRLDRTVAGFSTFEVRKVLHSDPEDLQSILQNLGSEATEGLEAGTFAVAVDGPTNSLVLRAEPSVQALLAEVIDTLDQPPPRIYVEAMLVEIVASDSLALGFDWLLPFSNTSNDPNPSFGGFALLNPSGGGLTGFEGPDKPAFGARIARRPVTIPIVGIGGEIVTVVIPRQSVVITADQGIVKSQVLQHPHLLLISGEEHEIFAGNEVPIPVSNTAANVGVPATNVDFQRQDVGVRLRVRPTLGQGGRVNMDVDIETSQVRSAATLVSGSQGPVIQQRAITTKIVLDDDETALIGMGTLGDTQELDVGTPWFKDIPMLGWLFRRTQKTRVKTHLVVTLQARVQRGPESDIAETIRRRLGVERALSRVRGLARTGDPRWALRVATLEKRDDAVDVAAHFERLGEQTEIISWTWHESPRHDVLLDGFDSLADASQAALRARDEGFAGELVPVPAKAR